MTHPEIRKAEISRIREVLLDKGPHDVADRDDYSDDLAYALKSIKAVIAASKSS